MPSFELQPHPSTPCPFVTVSVNLVQLPDGGLRCAYEVRGEIARLNIPATSAPVRTDGLWRHMCFELFIRAPDGLAYDEFNFSPGGPWAAYRFERYRSGMTPLATVAPQTSCDIRPDRLLVDVTLARVILPSTLALSAVLEDRNGGICYWALRHADGRPDFHRDESFAATIS